jgi:hypothetical protein
VVLAVKVGRQRKPAVGFGLALATFNVYSYFWDYKAHREVFDQFELGREGRGDAGYWYFLSTALPVLRFPYYYSAVANVQHIRQRLGLPKGITPAGFLGLTIPAVTLLLIGYFVGTYLIVVGIDGEDDGLVGAGLGVLLGGLAVYVALETVAYVRLQTDINGVWDAYDRRRAQLMASPVTAGWVPVPPTAPVPAPQPPPGPRSPPPSPASARPPSPRAPPRGGPATSRAPRSPGGGATRAKTPAAPAAPRRPRS